MLEWLPPDAARLVLAGGLGGMVNWLTRRAKWQDGVTQMVVGAICSVYLSPVAIPLLDSTIGGIVATPEEITRLSGFVIGLGGVTVSGFFLDVWHRRREALTKDAEKKDA